MVSKNQKSFTLTKQCFYNTLDKNAMAKAGCLLIIYFRRPANMTSYEIAMLAIAILSLIVNAVALFKQTKK